MLPSRTVAFAALIAACADVATSTTATATDGRATCTWRAGAANVVAREELEAPLCVLRDLAPTGDGAWLLATCATEGGALKFWPTFVSRLDARGVALDRAGASAATLHDPYELRDDFYSLAVDDTLGRSRALVWRDDVPSPTPELMAASFRDADAGADPTPLRTALPLAHYQHLRARADGFTCVAERTTAPWGVTLVHLKPDGAADSARDLGLPTTPVPFQRIALSDRSFVMVWTEGGALRLRRYDEDGVPRTDASSVLDAHASGAPRAAVVLAGDGMLAVWETGASLTARRLAADGTPTADARVLAGSEGYAGGLHATAAGRDALVSAVVGDSPPRLVMLPLDAAGASRGAAMTVPVVGRTNGLSFVAPWATRVVATPSGALVAFESERRELSAMPLTCAR